MSMCTLAIHHVSACEWGGMLAGTLVYRQAPDLVGQNMGPELLGQKPNHESDSWPSGALLALFYFCRCIPSRC